LRTIEEFVRFVRNDPGLTRRLKEQRHSLQNALSGFSQGDLLGARESGSDVGKASTSSEKRRTTARCVAIANFKRCQEAARVLEEYTKLVRVPMAEEFKEIRFALYSIEKEFILR
jgi:thiamine-phosphate pyrophosphorylase